MKKLLLTVLAVGIALALWVVATTAETPPSTGSFPIGVQSDPVESKVKRKSELSWVDAATRRTEPPPDSAAALQAVSVVGRCLSIPNGPPLAGLQVRSSPLTNLDGTPQEVATGTTDEQGRFALTVRIPFGRVIRTTIEGEDVAARKTLDLAEGPILELGDLVIDSGVGLQLYVRDAFGTAQAGVRLKFQLQSHSPEFATQTFSLVSGPTGRAEPTFRIPPGNWKIVPGKPAALVSNSIVALLHDADRTQLEVVVALPSTNATLSGRVFLPSGAPAADVNVIPVATTDDSRLGEPGLTDSDGRFRIRAVGDSSTPVRLRIPGSREFAPLITSKSFDWGTSGVKLKLREGRTLEVELVAAGDGAPLSKFVVSWSEEATTRDPRRGRSSAGPHPGGLVTLTGLPSGPVRVVGIPSETRYAPSTPATVKLPETKRVRLVSRRAIRIRVLVVDQADQALVGNVVDLVRNPHRVEMTDRTPAAPRGRFERSQSATQLLRLDKAITDHRGQATLLCPDDGSPATLRVRAETHLARSLAVVPQADLSRIRIVGASQGGDLRHRGASRLAQRLAR